ncbi:MAG TPA: DUF3137 domain-containing protein, partial [Spirochaetia bacterium]|nr:DUF3137 domain-containing protein [Spirochaetia bacterium]
IVLLIGAVMLVLEILYWVLIAGWKGILITPMVIGTLIVFGLIYKGVRFAFSIPKFQAMFNEKIGTRVAQFLEPELVYQPLYNPDWKLLTASSMFYDHGAAEGASHFSGKIQGIDVEFFYFNLEYIANKFIKVGERRTLTQTRGLFFIAHLNRETKGALVVRKKARKKKALEIAQRLGYLYTAASIGVLQFFAEVYEIYKDATQKVEDVLPIEVIEGMNAFAEQVKFPVTFSLSDGKFFYFVESESFYMVDRDEINTDLSYTKLLHRYHQDLKLALDSVSILKLAEIA